MKKTKKSFDERLDEILGDLGDFGGREIRINSDSESMYDNYKDGRLEGRDVHIGDKSYSMRYDSKMGAFFGSVTQGKDGVYNAMYHCTEYVGEKWAKLPYPKLNELRDLLAKEWADDIKKHLAKKNS